MKQTIQHAIAVTTIITSFLLIVPFFQIQIPYKWSERYDRYASFEVLSTGWGEVLQEWEYKNVTYGLKYIVFNITIQNTDNENLARGLDPQSSWDFHVSLKVYISGELNWTESFSEYIYPGETKTISYIQGAPGFPNDRCFPRKNTL